MLEDIKLAVGRIVGSQKAIYAMVPIIANTIAALLGHDVTTPVLLVLDATFGWGSPSDGTGGFAALVLCGLRLSGCSFDVALYQDDDREILPVKAEAIGSFCFAGLSVMSWVNLPAFGWGDLSCGDVISPGVPDVEAVAPAEP